MTAEFFTRMAAAEADNQSRLAAIEARLAEVRRRGPLMWNNGIDDIDVTDFVTDLLEALTTTHDAVHGNLLEVGWALDYHHSPDLMDAALALVRSWLGEAEASLVDQTWDGLKVWVDHKKSKR